MSRKLWLNVGFAVTMLASVALVGCGGDKTTTSDASNSSGLDATQELNLAFPDEIPTMDISKATNTISFTLFNQTSEGLVRLDKTGKAAPAIAKSWEHSADGLTYTFHLRDDAKWSNGEPVTANDFEYSWKRTLDPKVASEYAFMVSWIKGGADYNAGKSKDPNTVAVKATDDKTLTVTLDHPIPFFVEQTAFPIFFPQNKKFAEAAGDKYGADADKFLSNGPFKLTEWNHEQNATVVKNDQYYDKDKVKLTKVTWQMIKDTSAAINLYESGQLDRSLGLVRDQVDTYKSSPDFGVVPELTTIYLQYNQSRPQDKVLTNAKVRQALTWAVDGDAYADVVYHNGSKGATGYTPAGISDGNGGDFTKDVGDLIKRKENLAKAKETFAAGLKELNMSTFPTNIKLLVDDNDVGKKAAELVKEQWRQNLGINVEVDMVPYKLRLQRSHAKDFDMVISLWGADYNDPMTFLDMFVTNGDFNNVGWSNAQYDKDIAGAKTETDPKKRLALLEDAEKTLMNDMPIGPVAFRGRAYITKPYVKNFKTFVNGPDYELKETYISGKK
jgi:oligopeptide transport system substrate-binding protein